MVVKPLRWIKIWGVRFVLGLWVLLGLGFGWSPGAIAAVPITLSDLSYHECSAEVGEGSVAPGGMIPANCYIVTGKAENKSGKLVVDADIFGRIYDANNNPVMQNRNRLGAIPEVPMGVSEFELRISVPANLQPPLKLEKFKAVGFSGKVSQFKNIVD
jgi:hypothetical protein